MLKLPNVLHLMMQNLPSFSNKVLNIRRCSCISFSVAVRRSQGSSRDLQRIIRNGTWSPDCYLIIHSLNIKLLKAERKLNSLIWMVLAVWFSCKYIIFQPSFFNYMVRRISILNKRFFVKWNMCVVRLLFHTLLHRFHPDIALGSFHLLRVTAPPENI